jgi:hypothetical protein
VRGSICGTAPMWWSWTVAGQPFGDVRNIRVYTGWMVDAGMASRLRGAHGRHGARDIRVCAWRPSAVATAFRAMSEASATCSRQRSTCGRPSIRPGSRRCIRDVFAAAAAFPICGRRPGGSPAFTTHPKAAGMISSQVDGLPYGQVLSLFEASPHARGRRGTSDLGTPRSRRGPARWRETRSCSGHRPMHPPHAGEKPERYRAAAGPRRCIPTRRVKAGAAPDLAPRSVP